MKLKYKKLYDIPVVPKYMTDGASGIDLCAVFSTSKMVDFVMIAPGESEHISTGLAFEIPEGFEGQIRPRSGHAKRGLVAAFGTIDSDYRGEVGVRIFNHSFKTQKIELYERIAQLVICPVVRCELEESETLSETIRGSNGFGSTNKR